MKPETRLLIGILVVDLVLVIFGIFGTTWFGWHQLRMLSLATASIGVVTFIGFFAVTYGPGLVIERAMRNSITASVIAMYLVTVGIVTFFTLIKQEPGTSVPEINPLTKTMVDSFQTVVTVVVGFYFTSSAVVEGIQRMRTGNVPKE